jgi:glycosyltransferase involved in cell wall biosynthesis
MTTISDDDRIAAFLDQTLAVLVLYRRALAESPTVVSLNCCLTACPPIDLFVYDNSPEPQAVELAGTRMRVEYHHNPSNPGVSTAYNEGARIARRAGKKWLLLLDQDTIFPENAMTAYAGIATVHPEVKLFAPLLFSDGLLLSPCGFRLGAGYHLKEVPSGRMQLDGRGILNSGMLVDLDAFEAVGGFDERIPLDFADHDFCRRFAIRFGESLIIDLACKHGFSNREESTIESALVRYALFCRGARQSIRSFPDMVARPVVAICRCLVLTGRYRTCRFIPVLLREFGCF